MKNRHIIASVSFAVLLIALGIIATATPSFAASFDCSKASTSVEHMICQNDSLSKLDEQMVDQYRKVLANSADPDTIRYSQIIWLQDQRNKCADVSCLSSVYQQRIAQLESDLPATQSAPSQSSLDRLFQAPSVPPAELQSTPQVHQNATPDSSVSQVTRCDVLAGSPSDPNKVVPGVLFAMISADDAIAACQNATKADSTNPRLWFELGRAEQHGNLNAVDAYRKAGEKGYVVAQYNLGWLYASGQDVPKDDLQAVIWWQRAANQGYAPAQYALGQMYQYGRGVSADDDQAAAWYKKAADQRFADANTALAGVLARRNHQGEPQGTQQSQSAAQEQQNPASQVGAFDQQTASATPTAPEPQSTPQISQDQSASAPSAPAQNSDSRSDLTFDSVVTSIGSTACKALHDMGANKIYYSSCTTNNDIWNVGIITIIILLSWLSGGGFFFFIPFGGRN